MLTKSTKEKISYRLARKADLTRWLRLRRTLWPDGTAKEHREDILRDLRDPVRTCFVAEKSGRLIGFLEASLRSIADDCYTSPVGYIEGWFVVPTMRRKGIGQKLVEKAEAWALRKGCQEMASDAHVTNKRSIQAHKNLGYTAQKPVVRFHKKLP